MDEIDEPAADQGPYQPRHARPGSTASQRKVAAGIAALVLVVGGAALFLAKLTADDDPKGCMGVGLIGEPTPSSTADGAMRLWLKGNPNEPPFDDWDRGDEEKDRDSTYRSVAYETNDSDRYWRVFVGTEGVDRDGNRLDDGWYASSACVRPN